MGVQVGDCVRYWIKYLDSLGRNAPAIGLGNCNFWQTFEVDEDELKLKLGNELFLLQDNLDLVFRKKCQSMLFRPFTWTNIVYFEPSYEYLYLDSFQFLYYIQWLRYHYHTK